MRSIWYLEDICNNNKNNLFSLKKTPIIVLASTSKNRLKLLQQIGINPIVEASNYVENLPKTLQPIEYVTETAKFKALKVAEKFQKINTSYDVIIGCDTIVLFNGDIIGKPESKEDALNTLKKLNNNKHTVYTGVVLLDSKLEKIEKFYEETVVEFGNIPESVLKAYVDFEEPMNCAGSYAIQGKAGCFIKSITGCYNNIVGLPLYKLVKQLQNFL